MSELTSCNYCNLRRIKARAKEEGKKVTILADSFGISSGGRSVYVHPKETKIKDLDEKGKEKYFSSWMMEIPDSCCC